MKICGLFVRIVFVGLFSIFICASFVQIVSAASPVKQKGLTLSPLRTELNIAPGTSQDGVLSVTNSTKKPMIVNLSAEVFSVINQQYDYAFTEESNVVKWASFRPSSVDLAPGESKEIKYTVGVPLSAEPGGRYVSLFASTDTGSSNNDVESRQRVASLLYVTVLGDVTRSGHLVSLTSTWLIGGEGTWNTALQNTGTTHFRSRYNVQVKDLVWNGTAASMSGEALILPGTVRSVSDVLPAPKIPGIYKAIYTIGLGDTPAVVETRYILYMPPMAILVSVAIIIFSIPTLSHKRKTRHGQI